MKDAVAPAGKQNLPPASHSRSLVPILPTPPLIPRVRVKASPQSLPEQDVTSSLEAQPPGLRKASLPLLPAPPPCRRCWPSADALLNTLSPAVPAHTPCDAQAAVPSTFWQQRSVSWKTVFPQMGAGRGEVWFLDDPSALRLLCRCFSFVAISGYAALT